MVWRMNVVMELSPGLYLSHWLEHHVRCEQCKHPMTWRRQVPGLHVWAALCCGQLTWHEFDALPAVN